MKQAKRLTRNQKIILSKRGIAPKGLYLLRELPNSLTLVDKAGKTMVYDLESGMIHIEK